MIIGSNGKEQKGNTKQYIEPIYNKNNTKRRKRLTGRIWEARTMKRRRGRLSSIRNQDIIKIMQKKGNNSKNNSKEYMGMSEQYLESK